VTQIIDLSLAPVGLCDKCAMDKSIELELVAAAQLAGFVGIRRYPPSGQNWYRKGRRASGKKLWALLREIETPHVVAAMGFAIAVKHRIPASWLTPRQWIELLEAGKAMYKIVGGKHEHE